MEEVIKYLEELPEEKWETKVGKSWNVKNVVAHLIAWNYEAAKEIERVYRESGEPWFLNAENYDDFNAKAVAKYKGFSKKQLIKKLKESDREVDKAVEKCGRENLINKPGFKWLFETDRKPHSVQHLDKIKEALEK